MKNRKKQIFGGLLVLALLFFLLAVLKGRHPSVEKETIGSVVTRLDRSKKPVSFNETSINLSDWLVRKGTEDHLTGRLQQALKNWELALYLNPENRLAEIKLDRGKKEMEEQVEREYTQGLYSFKYMHFEQAIEHWQRVLRLVIDSESPRYQEAVRGISHAREKLATGRMK